MASSESNKCLQNIDFFYCGLPSPLNTFGFVLLIRGQVQKINTSLYSLSKNVIPNCWMKNCGTKSYSKFVFYLFILTNVLVKI